MSRPRWRAMPSGSCSAVRPGLTSRRSPWPGNSTSSVYLCTRRHCFNLVDTGIRPPSTGCLPCISARPVPTVGTIFRMPGSSSPVASWPKSTKVKQCLNPVDMGSGLGKGRGPLHLMFRPAKTNRIPHRGLQSRPPNATGPCPTIRVPAPMAGPVPERSRLQWGRLVHDLGERGVHRLNRCLEPAGTKTAHDGPQPISTRWKQCPDLRRDGAGFRYGIIRIRFESLEGGPWAAPGSGRILSPAAVSAFSSCGNGQCNRQSPVGREEFRQSGDSEGSTQACLQARSIFA